MKKSLILALVAVIFACVAHAGVVTPAEARQVAAAWSARNAAFGVSAADVGAAVHFADANGVTLWYQVQMGTSCLIVSPVTELEPVVAALENVDAEEGLPAGHPMLAMLTRDMTDRLKKLGRYQPQAPSGGATLLGAAPMSGATPEDPEFAAAWAQEGEARWSQLLPKGGFQLMAVPKEEGITEIDVQIGIVDGFEQGGRFTHWDQGNAGGGPCFNYYTTNHAVCGCVATSMGALMQFFAVTGCVAGATCPDGLVRETQDSVKGASYVDADGNVTTGFKTLGGDYDWSLFSGNQNRASYDTLTEPQRELLGRVAYDCGVAVAMEWTSGESSAYVLDVAAALRKVFGFKAACAVFNPTEEQYAKLIYYQCWAGAPVQLGISGAGGHSVLAVGYGTDDGGIPRVRVFTGWGGRGDGWYALPYITTASVPGGGNYRFDVVQQVVTMIDYQDDKVIPVCGRIIPSLNATVECSGITTNANENGYFGLRISASEDAGVKSVSVQAGGATKTGSVVLGTAATPTSETYFYDAADLCAWIPDDIIITLLKSETASTFAEAKEKALATIGTEHPKAILAFSGTWGTNFTVSCELATAAAWDYLYSLDQINVDDFTNKYVVLCTPYSLSGTSASDGNPSFAVFEPRAITTTPDKLWSFYNGRLSYWTIGSAICTTDTNLAASATNNVVEGGSLTTYVTCTDITNALISVMDSGREAFLQGVSGITLEVVGSGGKLGAVEPAYGFYENTYSNGESIVATAPEFVTNSTQKIEFRCVGWTLASTNSAEVLTGTGTSTNITLVANGAYTLTWLWETNAVKITTEVLSRSQYGVIEPSTGWFPYGEDVTFIATGNTLGGKVYTLNNWPRNGKDPLNDNDSVAELGNMLVFRAMRPATIQAEFRSTEKTPAELGTFNLKVVNYGTDDAGVPSTLLNAVKPAYEAVSGVPVPYDTETELVQVPLSAQLATNSFTDASGNVRTCNGWMISNEAGILDSYKGGLIPSSMASFNPLPHNLTNGTLVTLTWLWEQTSTNGVTNVFDIAWSDDLANLSSGYTTNLMSEAELASKGWNLNDLTVSAPTGWVATVSLTGGNVVATLVRDDDALEAAMETCSLAVVPNADGTITVKATISGGLRGFWYVLYGSDDLTTWEAVADGTYESGTSAAQAKGSAKDPVDTVELSITVTPGDSAAGAKRFYKVVSGATKTPLAE